MGIILIVVINLLLMIRHYKTSKRRIFEVLQLDISHGVSCTMLDVSEIIREISAILIIIQIFVAFILYNFSSNLLILSIGWIILSTGLILVILSSSHNLSEKYVTLLKYPVELGWMLVAMSLTLISQQWFSIVLTIAFLSAMSADVYLHKNSSQVEEIKPE